MNFRPPHRGTYLASKSRHNATMMKNSPNEKKFT